jgi:predicted AlkP superfamily pyrophosphatase or phosphodiesterase
LQIKKKSPDFQGSFFLPYFVICSNREIFGTKNLHMRKLLFLAITLFLYLISASAQENKGRATVILSLDGFRWDYPDKTSTPNLNKMAREGVKAVSLIPSFPSKTFPNHYTIATGLVPDHHGLVNNSFYDTVLKKSYSIGNKDARFNPEFYGGEPIWVTAAKQGVRTASFYWVGSDVAVQGIQPDYWKHYDDKVSLATRIDTIIRWLSLPDETRPKLIMVYYHEPDGIGHDFGPDDPRTLSLVHKLDSMTGLLYDRIKQLPDGNNINFMVVSDHGMGSITSLQNTALRDFIPEAWPVRIEGGNPNFNIYTSAPWVDSVYLALRKAPGIKVWKPEEVPSYLNYGTNPRVGDIIVVADSAWSITLNKPKSDFIGGTHGYDILNTDIHAVFYAAGPDFKQGYIQPAFQNIHIYSLLAHLLGLVPAKNDGDLKCVIDMLNL